MQRIFAAVLIATLTAPAWAATAGSRLEGKVLGPDGKPVRGAKVTVRALEGETSWVSQPTDKRGRYSIHGIHYGWDDLIVTSEKGEFLGDQAINLPPGTKVVVDFNLLETADKPASWWADRRVEPPAGITVAEVAGMAQSSQKMIGVEYWKTPAGIAILVSVGVIALAAIAAGGGSYNSP